MNEVLYEAHTWLADDPDPATRAELRELIRNAESGDSDALADLGDRFTGFLTFGTAGLRGALGAGPNRMNRSVVIRAAAGLAGYLNALREPVRGDRHRVVIGYDARHGSETFALDTAAVMTGAGVEAMLMPRVLPTPVLAFAIRHLNADAGVMVTASHNPPQDNGYKVYLGGSDGGSQIVAPIDAEIASYIRDVRSATRVRRAPEGWTTLDEDLVDAYVEAAAAVASDDDDTRSSSGPQGAARGLRIVLTSLHGVGGRTVMAALARAGFTDVHPVPEQAEPDPDFPTVAFPNPEEPGAMDLALRLAEQVGADIVLANDPDADRLAVALPVPDHQPDQVGGSRWQMLHGDQVGALLGVHLASKNDDADQHDAGQEQGDHLHADQAREPGRTGPPAGPGTFANSIVSSRLLGRVAVAHDIPHVETLTGFKWISRVPELAYGYEEALGYCVDPGSVRDKDGISAAVLFAELAGKTKAAGRTPWDVLDDLARSHGLHATDQLSFRVEDPKLITEAMRRLRRRPPTELGGSPVVIAQDLHSGAEGLPPTAGLRYYLADDSRVVVRPSGTEPKLKCYLEVIVAVDDGNVRGDGSVADVGNGASLGDGDRAGAGDRASLGDGGSVGNGGTDGHLGIAAARATAAARLEALRADMTAALGL